MFELIKLLSLYKTNAMYIGFTKPAGTVKGYPIFYWFFKTVSTIQCLYSSGAMPQILGPRYETLSIPLQTVLTKGVSKWLMSQVVVIIYYFCKSLMSQVVVIIYYFCKSITNNFWRHFIFHFELFNCKRLNISMVYIDRTILY